jgi:hypothetical protein
MRINPFVYGFLVLAVFLGVIYAFQDAGLWSTSGKVNAQGGAVQPEASDVTTIKGWMTLEQISTTYNVSLEEIIQAFNLPAGTPSSTAVKDLESESFSVSGLRDWLASRASSEAASPTRALVQPTPTPLPTAVSTPPASEAGEHTTEDYKISGQTTFQDLLDWGLTRETIETVAGIAMPDDTSLRLREYLSGNGVRFSEVKAKLQDKLDEIIQP